MRLVLEYLAGPCRTPLIWLTEGQGAVVGRTELADHAVSGDVQMSGRHFSVSCARSACEIRDLNSTNGTFVNERRIRESPLRDGDTIRAGQTSFLVRLTDPARPPSPVIAPPFVAPPRTSDGVEESLQLAPDELEPELVEEGDWSAGQVPPATPAAPPAPISPTLEMTVPPELAALAAAKSRPIVGVWLTTCSSGPVVKVWLAPGQEVVVGRGEAADCRVAHDEALSATHFRVICETTDIRVRDLESREGTFVNQQLIRETRLLHGDRVTAGATDFEVRVNYEDDADERRRADWPACTSTRLLGGVMRFRSTQPEPAPLTFARELARWFPLYALINYSTIGRSAPPNPTYLQNWLSPTSMSRQSPVVLSAAGAIDIWTEIEQAWGRDGLICVFARLETPRLLQHLRCLARGQTRPNGAPQADWQDGFRRPSRLAAILASGNPSFARYVFDGIDAILIESQSASHWEILAPSSFVEQLDELGVAVRGTPDS